ncbi:hypothetical protein PsorP6_012837 [Peronosclerospora sorghi]|uniref:Uncharacterized protein n=1 Tax=Peronosclerospora sorghi TaxID=230839 RepID=A0ACC0WE70_9STRA|nr:hypothetical protein PsorP6_012837 [Peronosclerospora sorghi]
MLCPWLRRSGCLYHLNGNTKLQSQVDERVMVVSGDDDEGGEGKQRRGSRWSKFFPLHPTVQHVFSVCPETEPEEVYDDSETLKTLPNEVIAVLQASSNGQVTTESSFSETFGFREYLDASSFAAPDMKLVDLTLSRSEEDMDSASANFAEKETSLVDELVETHGMQEHQVRELLAGMEQARAKRGGRERNSTLADRYLPVNARGLVGSREPLHTLFSWLNAWKVGGGDREKLNCFESGLFTFEDGDCESGDEVGDLCRLFILEGESGSGKSAAVYACAEELGYEISEINAAQNRSGKSIIELAGEATQSTCVLHIKSKKKHKKNRRRHSENRKSLDYATAASLSLVMFEDIDVVFDEDKGFYNAVCSIAKHSKCPIVITCAQLPDTFPAKPRHLCRELRKPSMDEFATWMRLVASIEGLKVAPSLINVPGTFFDRDVRRSLHFLEVHLPNSESSTKTNWRWQHEHSEKNEVSHVDIPPWTTWSTGSTSFDPLTSNLLLLNQRKKNPFEDKGREEKQAEVYGMIELAQIMESASVADVWMVNASASGEDGTEVPILWPTVCVLADSN